MEELRSFLRWHRKPDAQSSGLGNQIGSNQEYPIPDRPQSPFKPTGRKHRLPEPHQEIVEDAARSEGRIGRVKRLETERVQTQILFQLLDPILAVRALRVHAGHQLRGVGHGGDEDPIGITRTLDQPSPTGVRPVGQCLMQAHKPPVLPVLGWHGGHEVGDRDAPREGAPVGFGNPVDHQLAYERRQPRHDDVRKLARV